MASTATKPAQGPPARQLRAVTGRIESPLRILLHGVEGIGKTTWASKAPAPVFICAEAGTDELDVHRHAFDDNGRTAPETWAEVLGALRDLAELPHDRRTVVVDTADALEALCWKKLCVENSKANIEEFGYGKGYIAALNEWRVLLSALERLRRDRGMGVILIAHSLIKPFKNPEGDDYDRYELKLHIKAGGLMKEWVDDVLFAHYETFAVKNDKGQIKGVSSGARVIETVRTAAWDAKNRHSLPATLQMDIARGAQAFVEMVRARHDPKQLRESITAKLAELADNEVTAKVQQLVDAAKDNAAELASIDNRMTATLKARKGA